MTSAIFPATTYSYGYDAVGNRTSATIGANTYTYAYPATSNRLTSTTGPAPAKNFTYNAAGNANGDGTVSYTYNAPGRAVVATVAGVNLVRVYNGLGQRVVRASQSDVLVFYAYDEAGRLLMELNVNTVTGARIGVEYLYLGDVMVALQAFTIAAGQAPTYVGQFNVHTDHLDTPRLVTNVSNQARWTWVSDPFGMLPAIENPAGLGIFPFSPRFPGQVIDKETNLHYNMARDYDPATGRYIQSDPIGLGGGINTYAYAYENPLSFFDPDGLQVRLMCRLLDDPLARLTARFYGQPQKHCFVYVSCPEEGWAYTLSLFGIAPGFNQARKNIATLLNPVQNDDPNSPNLTNDILITPQNPGCGVCAYEKDVRARFNRFPKKVPYYGAYLNSNSFANQMIYSPAFGAAVPQGAVANAPGLSSSYSIIGIGR